VRSIRETVEDAAIEAISSKHEQKRNASSGYLGLVGAYNGELDETDGLDDFRRRIRGQFPAVLVAAGPAVIVGESVTRRQFRRELQVEVYSASDNWRSREHRLRNDPQLDTGATRDPGIYTLLEHIFALVAGTDFGLAGVSPATPLREEPLLQLPELCVWRTVFEFKTDAHVEPWETGDGQMLTSYFLKSQIAEEPPDVSPNPIVESEGTIPE
jgi:hypothetical protein